MMTRGSHRSADVSFVAMAALTLGWADALLIDQSILGAAGAFQFVPRRLWVAAPLCWIVAAVVVALPIYAIARRHAARLSVIALGALFIGARVYTQAPVRIVLSIGVLVALASGIWLVSDRWLAAPRPLAAWLSGGVMMALGVAAILITRSEDAAGIVARRSPAPGAPDVIVVFVDTASYDTIFPDGTNVDPQFAFLSRLAARSVVFENAYTPSPWTLPAHLSAVTGVPAYRLGIGFDHQEYRGTSPTLATRFQRRGYRTAAVISNTFLNRGTGFARGFETFEHAQNALDACRTAPARLVEAWSPWFAASVCNWSAGEVTRRAMEQVEEGDRRPLFLMLNYMDAHDPYYVEPECGPAAGGNGWDEDIPPGEYRRRYYPRHVAAIRCIDRHLARLSARIDARGREVVFAVLADHGEQFGEHGLVRHGNSLYAKVLHVPFLVSRSNLVPRRVTTTVSIEALPGIIASLADAGHVGPVGGPVVSNLVPPLAAGNAENWSMLVDRWHLIRGSDGDALYDLERDGGEQRNLARAPGARSLLDDLAQRIEREKVTRADTRAARFRSLGYIR